MEVQTPVHEGAILRGGGRGVLFKSIRTLQSPVQKRLNRSRCRLHYGLSHRNHVLDEGPVVLRDVAMATNFGTPFSTTGVVGYNCRCVIASDTLFDSRGGFSASSYPMKT